MAKVAVLGLGAMGSRMAARLMEAGHDTRVWNRTLRKNTVPGVKAMDSPARAADGADLVLSMVRDDAASEAVWLGEGGALQTLAQNAVAADASTISPAHARHLGEVIGPRFLHTPVIGSRPQAEAGQLVVFAGGGAEEIEKARPVLSAFAGSVHPFPSPEAASLAKLSVNGMFALQLAALAELFGLARKSGSSDEALREAIAATPVLSPAAAMASQAMLAGNFAPAFPIDLVEKDLQLLTDAAEKAGARAPLASATCAVFGEAKANGYSGDNITGIAQIYP